MRHKKRKDIGKELQYKIYTPKDKLTAIESKECADFLYEELGQYGDSNNDILAAITYAMGINGASGGYVICARKKGHLKSVVVVNHTGMKGYIPESILVYIAVHQSCRGQGIGKHMMGLALKMAPGDVALHVEADNPAKHLYLSLGFDSKYLEMRYIKSSNK